MLPFFLIFSIYAIGIFDFLGRYYGWYYSIWWFDIPMHIAGGAWLAGVLYWKIGWSLFQNNKRAWREANVFMMSFFLIISVLVVGILWEIFETIVDIFIFREYNSFFAIPLEIQLDSAADLINDLIGVLLIIGGFALYERKVLLRRA